MKALRALAESYWYCSYARLRRTGLDPASVAAATLAGWTRWLTTDPPQPQDAGAARLREWLPARLASNATHDGPPAFAIDAAWAEQRFVQEPDGDADAIFHRRWALTVLEFTVTAHRGEYAASGTAALFDELLPFSGFENVGAARYGETAARVGLSTGAVRKAVFDFRTRQREILRGFVGDTVADPADIDSEITALLCAADAPGPAPTALHALHPEEMLARAMQSAKISSASGQGWTPLAPEEMAHLFPNYEILSMLGRGGMGAVYKARQIELDRLVALKLLPLEISVNQDFADRFRREARAMAKLNHPNIITVHDFGQTAEGHLFFAMEFVEGANLHDIIHGPGLDAEHALSIAAQVCTALAYAHGKGVVHRDMKPANVMIDTGSEVKVADFGLARLLDAGPDTGTTRTGTVMGTPDYMAPEQKKGMSVDHRADIYSLGVMLYEMLCRETPQGAFAPPSQRTGCDARIDKIVLKAMQQAPERRYQSTTEMKADVDSARTPPPATPSAAVLPAAPKYNPIIWPPEAPAPTPAPAPLKSKTLHNVGIALAVAAIIGGVIHFTQSKQERTFANASEKQPFVNSLGMRFVPVLITGGPTGGQRVLFSVWPTRVMDYAAFARVNSVDNSWAHQEKDGVPVGREPANPLRGVSWGDAKAFCEWLSEQESAEGKLPQGMKYRLPTDEEWTRAMVAKHEGSTLNEFGILVDANDVLEWCEDLGERGSTARVLRSASDRRLSPPGTRNIDHSFRVVLAPASATPSAK